MSWCKDVALTLVKYVVQNSRGSKRSQTALLSDRESLNSEQLDCAKLPLNRGAEIRSKSFCYLTAGPEARKFQQVHIFVLQKS